MQKDVALFIAKQTSDSILETKICRRCESDFFVFQKDRDLLDTIAPVIAGHTYSLPLPTLCPDCRQRRRQMFRNESKLYRRTCDLCGKTAISLYPQEYSGKVYCVSCWRSDRRDAPDFAQTYVPGDISSFLSYFQTVPHPALFQVGNEHSDYTNLSYNVKNCYLSHNFTLSENAHYVNRCAKINNSMDVLYAMDSEGLYEVVTCKGSHKIRFTS